MQSANLDLTTIRIFLHVLAVTVWVGGQIVMMALLPVLRSAGVDGLPAKAAQAFQNVAWPAFALAIFTGIWNFLSVDDPTSGWSMVFGIKFLFVVASGVAAFVHAKTEDKKMKAITGALGFLTALVAMFLGYVL